MTFNANPMLFWLAALAVSAFVAYGVPLLYLSIRADPPIRGPIYINRRIDWIEHIPENRRSFYRDLQRAVDEERERNQNQN